MSEEPFREEQRGRADAGHSFVDDAAEWIAKRKKPDWVDVDLPNATAAQAFQNPAHGAGGAFEIGRNSCVTRVKDVLAAGSLDVSSLPNSLDGGFWEALQAMRK